MPAPDSVVLETNLGHIQLELYWDHAPRVRSPFPILDLRLILSGLDFQLELGRPARTLYNWQSAVTTMA